MRHSWLPLPAIIAVIGCALSCGCTLGIWPQKGKAASLATSGAPDGRVKPQSKAESQGDSSTSNSLGQAESTSPSVQERVPVKQSDSAGGKGKSSEPRPSSSEATDPPFKKHDHAGYVTAVKNKAIDMVTKQSDAAYARICKNTTTDQWALVICRIESKTYSCTSYVWNEIDEKWEESFNSGKRPMTRWKEHLRYSSDGNECTVLKGIRLE